VIPNPLPALAFGDGSENIEAALEPVIEAVRDLDRLMLGMIGGVEAVHGGLRAVNGEVAVEFKHGVSGIDQVGSVHLDFIVVLSASERDSDDEDQERGRKTLVKHWPISVTKSHEKDYQLENEFWVTNR
jgi:hypothetical protein